MRKEFILQYRVPKTLIKTIDTVFCCCRCSVVVVVVVVLIVLVVVVVTLLFKLVPLMYPKKMYIPAATINGQGSWLMRRAPNQNLPVRSIKFGNFHCFLASISPINISCTAVHNCCHRVTHILQNYFFFRPIQVGASDVLQSQVGPVDLLFRRI